MSSGPTGTGETCIEEIKKGRVNIYVTKKDWCLYPGQCMEELTVGKRCICWYCTYMGKFNIPLMINREMGEKK